MRNLNDEFGITTLEQAKKRLSGYDDKIGKQEKLVISRFKKLQEVYEW